MKSKNDNLRYDRVRTYFKLNKKSFILTSITGVIYNSLMALVPIVQGKLIDAFNAQDDVKYIIKFALTFLTFVIFIQVNRYFKRYYVRDFSNKMVLQMRRVSFKNLITDDISTFITESKGDIMNKNLSDIKDSAEGVRKILTEVYDSIILMLGYLISLMIMDWKTTLVITIFLVLSMVFANLMKKIIYKSTSEYKKTFSKSKDVTLNSLKNELYYRGFGVCHKYDAIYQNTQNELEKKSIKSMVFKGSLEPTYQAIALIGLFFVIYFCGIKVTSGTWLVGTFSAYLSTYVLVANKASKVGKVFNAATNFKVSWKRCSPYLERKEMARHGDYKLKGNRLRSDGKGRHGKELHRAGRQKGHARRGARHEAVRQGLYPSRHQRDRRLHRRGLGGPVQIAARSRARKAARRGHFHPVHLPHHAEEVG